MVRSIIIFGIVTVLMPGVAVPQEPAPGDRAKQAEQARRLASGAVITNDVLERLYGPAQAGPPPDTAEVADGPSLPDPLKVVAFELGRRKEMRIKRGKAEERVQRAELSVQELESRRLAIVNPFLRRPVLTAGEAAAWEGLDNEARVRRTEEAIEAAREELEAARAELQRLQQGG